MTLLAWGSHDLLVDNSVYARRDHPIIEERWQQATVEDQLVLVGPLIMEVLYSAKNGTAAAVERGDLRAAYDMKTIDDDVWELAIQTQIELFESLQTQVRAAGLKPSPWLTPGK